jgi:hypothetical protein
MLTPAKRFLLPLVVLFLALSSPAAQEKEQNRNIRFGMPAPAKADPESREPFLIARPPARYGWFLV